MYYLSRQFQSKHKSTENLTLSHYIHYLMTILEITGVPYFSRLGIRKDTDPHYLSLL
jgi:hypothetical protein